MMAVPQIFRNPCPEVVVKKMISIQKLKLYEGFEGVIKNSPRPKIVCERIVRWLISVHRKNVSAMGGCVHCQLHDLLYVAARLVVNFRLRKESIVSDLLGDIYRCEGSFDRLFNGAIHGTVGTLNNGVMVNEFQSRRESIRALEFFLRSSKKYRMAYYHTGKFLPMTDIPLSNGELPLTVARRESGWKEVSRLFHEYGSSTK